MANPVVVEIPEWTWVKVATAVTSGFVNLVNGLPAGRLHYYSTYKETGDPAPSVPIVGTVPEEAVELFKIENQATVVAKVPIDVYVMCSNGDTNIAETGKVRVDL